MTDQLAVRLLHQRFGEREFSVGDLSNEDVERLLSMWAERSATTNRGRGMMVGTQLSEISRRSGAFQMAGVLKLALIVTRKANDPIQGKPALYQLRPVLYG